MRTTVILMLAIATVTGCSRSPSDREPTQTAHTDPQAECLLNLSLLHRTTEMCALAGNLSVEEQIDPKGMYGRLPIIPIRSSIPGKSCIL